jgi:hypothetical protein
MHCENCGAGLSEGARYCAGCGAPVPGAEQLPPEERRTWGERFAGIIGRSRKERMLAAGTVMAALMAIVAFVLLDTPDDAPTQDAFTREADAQCVAAKRLVIATGEKAATDAKPGAQERFTGAILEAVTDWRIAFETLTPTAGHAPQAEALDDAMLELIIELGTLSRRVREGSPQSVSAQAAATDDATIGLEAAIDDLGLVNCSTLSLARSVE